MLTRAPTTSHYLTPATRRLALTAYAPTMIRATIPTCPYCGGRGCMVPKLDGAALVPEIFASVGRLPFATRELLHHASVVDGPLRAALAGWNGRQIGRALERAEGRTFDDLTLVRLGKDRNRVALWCILPV